MRRVLRVRGCGFDIQNGLRYWTFKKFKNSDKAGRGLVSLKELRSIASTSDSFTALHEGIYVF